MHCGLTGRQGLSEFYNIFISVLSVIVRSPIPLASSSIPCCAFAMPSTSRLSCFHPGCPQTSKSQHGRTYHMRAIHANPNAVSDYSGTAANTHCGGPGPVGQRIEHPHLTGMCTFQVCFGDTIISGSTIALPCNSNGNTLPLGHPPSPQATVPESDWTPFNSKVQFKVADLVYHHTEISASNIDTLVEIWAQSLSKYGACTLFESHSEMHCVIDSSALGNIPWQCLMTDVPDGVTEHSPIWMQMCYEVWYHDPEAVTSSMLANREFNGQFDLHPYIDLDSSGKCHWCNVMSGNLAWRRSVSTHATSLCLITSFNALSSARMTSLHLTRLQKAPCTALSSSGAIRRRSWWRRDMWSTIPSTYLLA